ncbi:type II toxin-antitoxin system RatA family toxin [Rhodoblastus acidophilus]|uniref:Type II toxin-antitoxin system RatA family toxin n=1 Tax=Candidatus Rhodoblastus alkanivorans TaxID=2954117 RepID=A0ABS9ZAG7_9HYPH|nr:type II toxin-antitoxin system RatA family toxin [Candidatus Rhodoblastus alkanivorans]MCI4684345.1 type II toxin-antitoxin system RatA family toxin [Candidatus Rhodoblastus alkanivorans]MDI4641666.1 type II toxin-antitoxin system RatA family toxin [Rhodoblastus acidophilus]
MRRKFEVFFPHHGPEALFALVDDIEAYPAFVPACLGTRVLAREGAWRRVRNVFGLGRLRIAFVSEARADPPRELVIESCDGPLRALRLRWLFEPRGEGCLLTCDILLEFASGLFNALAVLAAPEFERKIVAAFERRAAGLPKGRAPA